MDPEHSDAADDPPVQDISYLGPPRSGSPFEPVRLGSILGKHGLFSRFASDDDDNDELEAVAEPVAADEWLADVEAAPESPQEPIQGNAELEPADEPDDFGVTQSEVGSNELEDDLSETSAEPADEPTFVSPFSPTTAVWNQPEQSADEDTQLDESAGSEASEDADIAFEAPEDHEEFETESDSADVETTAAEVDAIESDEAVLENQPEDVASEEDVSDQVEFKTIEIEPAVEVEDESVAAHGVVAHADGHVADEVEPLDALGSTADPEDDPTLELTVESFGDDAAPETERAGDQMPDLFAEDDGLTGLVTELDLTVEESAEHDGAEQEPAEQEPLEPEHVAHWSNAAADDDELANTDEDVIELAAESAVSEPEDDAEDSATDQVDADLELGAEVLGSDENDADLDLALEVNQDETVEDLAEYDAELSEGNEPGDESGDEDVEPAAVEPADYRVAPELAMIRLASPGTATDDAPLNGASYFDHADDEDRSNGEDVVTEALDRDEPADEVAPDPEAAPDPATIDLRDDRDDEDEDVVGAVEQPTLEAADGRIHLGAMESTEVDEDEDAAVEATSDGAAGLDAESETEADDSDRMPSMEDLRAMAADLDDVDAILERLDSGEHDLLAEVDEPNLGDPTLDLTPAE